MFKSPERVTAWRERERKKESLPVMANGVEMFFPLFLLVERWPSFYLPAETAMFYVEICSFIIHINLLNSDLHKTPSLRI